MEKVLEKLMDNRLRKLFATQLKIDLDIKPPQARKLNGKFSTRLISVQQEAANWKALYLGEITRQYYVSRKMRELEEENIQLKIKIQTFKN